MILKIVIAGSSALQITAGIIAYRHSKIFKERLLWLLLTFSFFLFSLYSFSFLFNSEPASITLFTMFRAMVLFVISFLFMVCIIGLGRQEALSMKNNLCDGTDDIEAALREKDVLLKEVHHRIKNNLQVIASILDLSSLEVNDRECCGLFEDAVAKISTMAIIHSQLYQNERFDRINMEKHLGEIVFYLKNFYDNGNLHRYEFYIENEKYISLNQGFPVTLILTELISNSLKHAFPGDGNGTISVFYSVDAGKNVSLQVVDTGQGFEIEKEGSESETMGLLLVKNLVQDQLKGSIEFIEDEGTRVVISFPFEDVYDCAKDNGC